MVEINTLRGLIEFLDHHHVPWRTNWGRKGNMPIGKLIRWIKNGEARLEHPLDGSPKPRLHISVAAITVLCKMNGRWIEIKELYQQFPDCRKERNFPGSLGEKFDHRKSPFLTAFSALIEELGQTEPRFATPSLYRVYPAGEQILERENQSDFYPGLWDVYHRSLFDVVIPVKLWHERYVEKKDNREIHFGWIQARRDKVTYEPCT